MSVDREPTLYDAGNNRVFCFNPGGSFDGWLLGREGDGKLFPIRQVNKIPYVPGTHLARLLPPPGAKPRPEPGS